MDDEFVLAQDLSGTEGKKIEDSSRSVWDAEDIHAVVALYDRGGNGTDGMMVASGVELAYPACAWADGNTGAVVVAADLTTEDPADVDLDAAARDTLKIRTEMLRPAG
ncbi:hypothetical protein [Streptomyces sp. NPDC026659]|uniref:hypothetical protein n=1 Tax=Streptomyces sp. NPDC026659 TaxID=3155123 RepID=UPI0033D5B14B